MKNLTNKISKRGLIGDACTELYENFIQSDEKGVFMVFNGVVIEMRWEKERSITKR